MLCPEIEYVVQVDVGKQRRCHRALGSPRLTDAPLSVFQDEGGRDLFDLPDAPRPDPDVPAPVRFLGEYDNILLGHADRTRIIPADFPWTAMLAPGRFVSNLLVDGELRATWWLERDGRRATLGIRPHRAFSRRKRDEVTDEAHRMLDFAAGEAELRDVRLEDPV